MGSGCKFFRAPHTAQKQKNQHNFPNTRQIISYFQDQLKFTKRHLLAFFSKKLNVSCYRHASFFPFFLFLVHFQRHMHSILAWNMIKRCESLQARYDTTYIYTVRLLTHVHCKPTHFVFHSFKADMPYSLQTNFVSVTKDWANKYHVWGAPTRSPSRSNSR